MPLVTSGCFLSLTTHERWEQIYLALEGTSECIAEYTILELQRAILGVLGSEECIYSPEGFWRAWAAFLGIECVESTLDAQRQIYGYYGGDEDCFYGLGPDGQFLALFNAISGGGGGVFEGYYYVSSSEGSDTNTGFNTSNPLASPSTALAEAQSQPEPVLGIRLKGGDTFYETVDWSLPNAPLEVYGDGDATLSGGVPVTGWTQVDAPNNVWRATFSLVTGFPRNLWVDGVRVTRPRMLWSEIGSGATIDAAAKGYNMAGTATPDIMADWGNLTYIEMVYRLRDWTEQRGCVRDVTGQKILMQTEFWDRIDAWPGHLAGPTWIENGRPIFDAAKTTDYGIFFFDVAAGVIDMVPPLGVSNPNESTVIAPVREQVLTASGGVNGWSLPEELVISHTTCLKPTSPEGFAEVQANAYMPGTTWRVPDEAFDLLLAAVEINGCNDITCNSTFLHLGGAGIQIKGDSSNVSLTGVYMRDVSSNGIIVGDPALKTGAVPSGINVGNCLPFDCAHEFIGGCQMIQFYADGVTWSHNESHTATYSIASLGLGWGLNDPITNQYTFEDNRLLYGMRGPVTDGALIYTNGAALASFVRRNYISESGGNGIYMDEGTSELTVTNNVITRSGTFKLHNTNNNVVNSISTDTQNSYELAGTNVDNTLTNPTADGATTAIANGEALNTGLEAAYDSIRSREGSVTYSTAGVVFSPNLALQGYVNNDPISSLIDKRYQVELTAAGSVRPTYLSAGLNGGPAMDFNSASSQVLTGAEVLITQTVSWTIIAEIKADSTTGVRVIFYNGDPASNGMGLLIFGGNWTVLLGGSAICESIAATTAPTVLTARFRYGGLTFWINGVETAITNNNVAAQTPTGGITIGAQPGSANFFDGPIGRISVYDRGLDDIEVERVHAEYGV